jgi:hypothetical protein
MYAVYFLIKGVFAIDFVKKKDYLLDIGVTPFIRG